jgi:glycosyltransferase involved in cell wall biosynthesis
MLVSVIVATHNRSASLKRCLEHLRDSALELGNCEVIVVDNQSSDATEAVVAPFVAESPQAIRYLFEPRRGKCRALNLGVAASRGEIVAFTDDDCYVSPTWFRSIFQEFESDMDLGGICGRVELFDPQDAPVSIRTMTDRFLLDSPDLALSIPMGANMAFRRRVMDAAGGFDPLLGPGSPSGAAAAEDNDFVYRVWKAGYKLVYSPSMWLYHHHGRRTAGELSKLRKNYVVGRGAFYCKHILKRDVLVAKLAYWELRNHFRTAKPSGTEREGVVRYLVDGACYELTARLTHWWGTRTRGIGA